MAKIDFDSDGAPFSGAILPTIEDVAALAADDGKEEVEAGARTSEEGGRRSRSILLPVNLILGLVTLGFLHVFLGQGSVDSAGTGGTAYPDISLEGVKDLRVIQRKPSEEALGFAAEGARKTGKDVAFFCDKDLVPSDLKLKDGVLLYRVPEDKLGSDGILLDGYRWYPLPP
jgi:hypothetical protein